MKVLVDTSVWSLALRRQAPREPETIAALKALVQAGRVVMIGPIRQELLSGIREAAPFDRLRRHLAAFPDLALTAGDYEEAARCFNHCRARGVQGSNTDFLICAVALRHGLSIFTRDRDFEGFARCLPIRLGFQ